MCERVVFQEGVPGKGSRKGFQEGGPGKGPRKGAQEGVQEGVQEGAQEGDPGPTLRFVCLLLLAVLTRMFA